MGNGFIYIMDLNLVVLITTQFFDSHKEQWDYNIYHEMELFKNRPFNGEEISTFFRDNYLLNIDYNFNGENIIKIYGFRDYVSELNGKQEIIYFERIEKFYKYIKGKNYFIIIDN